MKKRIPVLISMAVHVLLLLACIGILLACLGTFESPPEMEYGEDGINYGGLVLAFLLMFGVVFSFGGAACMAGLLLFEILDLILWKKGFAIVSMIGDLALTFAAGGMCVSFTLDWIRSGEGRLVPLLSALLLVLTGGALVSNMIRLSK